MTTPDDRQRANHVLPTVVSILIVLPLAVAGGAFCGWCTGTTAGGWFEQLGRTGAADFGGLLGGAAGAVFGAVHLVSALVRVKPGQRGEARLR